MALAVTGSMVWFGGPRGLLFFALYLLALVPGLPLGWWLFGRRHLAGWVAGGLIGYAATAMALSLAIRVGWANPAGYTAAWIVLGGAIWGLTPRPEQPIIALPLWTRRDAIAWLLVLHLVPALISLPFAHVGARDSDGNKQYRAYFIADFVWHMALTQEIARHDTPPRNPYMFEKPIHYYWTYFVVPAVMGGDSTAPVERVELALKVCATGTALLMLSTVFLAALAVSRRAWIAAAVTVLGFVGPSIEGAYALFDVTQRGAPLAGLRDVNIDAVTAWAPFGGLRVDGLMRSMLYTPQHSLSFALGMLAVIAGAALSTPLTVAGRLVVAATLGLSVIFNPFLGAAFTLIYGIALLADVVWERRGWLALFGHLIAAVPIGLGLAWCFWSGMAGGVGENLHFGLFGPARHYPFTTLMLSLGGLLVPAAFGLLPWRGLSWRPWVPAMAALVVGLTLMYFVSLSDQYWVGFRAGNILQVTLPMFVARALMGLSNMRAAKLGGGVVVAATLLGAPTTVIDAYNAQDVANRHPGPGFYWTDVLTPAQQAGLAWIRKNTPMNAVVQSRRLPGVVDMDRQNWSIVQSIAGRRSAAANAIPLLPEPENPAKCARVNAMFLTESPEAAYATAKALGIDYLWLDQEDAFRVDFLNRISTRHDLFYAVFQQGDVYVMRVN
jgi:hypothetical protein